MITAFERKVALRYLFKSRKKGFISFFAGFSFMGISLGVATLVIVMSVMNGFRTELLKNIIGMRGHIAIVNKKNQDFKSSDELLEKIRNIDGVQGIYETLDKQGIATHKGRASGVIVQGIRPGDAMKREAFRDALRFGSWEEFKDAKVYIGWRLTLKLNIQAGETLSIITPEGNKTAFGTIPRQKNYRVAGVTDFGMHQYDSGFVFLPLETAQNLYKTNDRISTIEIFVKNIEKATEIAAQIRSFLPKSLRSIDWKHKDQSIFNAVEVERNVMFIILTLLIIIAGFNIASSLIMLVKDKTRDIAIMRTMGACRHNIRNIFTSLGVLIGACGTVLGLSLGTLFCYNIESIRVFLEKLLGAELFSAEIYYLTKLPFQILMSDIYTITFISLGLSILASFIPARAAARLDPVEALRQ